MPDVPNASSVRSKRETQPSCDERSLKTQRCFCLLQPAAPQLTSVMLVSFIVGGFGNWIFNWRHAVERSDVMQVQQHLHHPRHHPGLGSSLRDAVQKPAGTLYVCSGPVWGQTSGVYRCAAAAGAPETVLTHIEVPLQQLFLMLHADVSSSSFLKKAVTCNKHHF